MGIQKFAFAYIILACGWQSTYVGPS